MGVLTNESPQISEEQPQTQYYSEFSLCILPYTGYLYRGAAISEITNKKPWDKKWVEYEESYCPLWKHMPAQKVKQN